MSDRQARRQSQHDQKLQRALGRRHPELVVHLREQLGFLVASAEGYDGGAEAVAKRLATTIRLLVHDTPASRSLLGQLVLLPGLQFLDGAAPIEPRNLLATFGLFMAEMSVRVEDGKQEGGARYIPYLNDGPHSGSLKYVSFDRWWGAPVSKLSNGTFLSRRDYVLTIADKEGGAHVDPTSDPVYIALSRDNALGVWYGLGPEDHHPVGGDPVLAAVRQVAHEVRVTLEPELRRLETRLPSDQ